MNIFLIGFMGCGKSTLGKKLAKKMSYSFLDSDKEIEQQEQISIQQIFDTKGEDYFRNLETEWLNNQKGGNSIISLGGGTPCFNCNIDLINSIGTSVYLQMNAGLLTNRLYHSKQKRPLIEKYKENKVQLEREIHSLLSQREVFYNEANIIFEASNMSNSKLDLLVTAINGNI